MNPKAQRIAIAEACGWKDEIVKAFHGLPDYLNDLNAMHEAEVRSGKIVGPAEWDRYCDTLRWVITQRRGEAGGPGSICGLIILQAAVGATANQRAEAFLRTIGRWEEEAKP